MIPTINYLLEFNKQNKFPLKIVIATANVSLQQQLLNQEIPSLNKAGLNFISVLAAGKNRYFCASNAINTLNNETLPIKETYLREELITAIGTNNWSGLKDDDHVQENLWPMISAKNATDKKCNICPNKEECGFIKERAKISSANIIVANHALVLSDIHSNRVLPSPENAIYIFDEAHHLPKTFRETLGQSLNFSTLWKTFKVNIKHTINNTKEITHLSETCESLSLEHATILCENSAMTLNTLFEHCHFYLKNKQQQTNEQNTTIAFINNSIPHELPIFK